MSKQIKIAYCIPSLYYPSGMERVLTLKANYFAEHFGYEIHIILTDGKTRSLIMSFTRLSPSTNWILTTMKCTGALCQKDSRILEKTTIVQKET